MRNVGFVPAAKPGSKLAPTQEEGFEGSHAMQSKTHQDSKDDVSNSESTEGDKKMAAKKMVITKDVEEMMEMQDEITIDWEHVLSMVPMPHTICQCILDISQHWTRDENFAQGVGTIQNWVAVLEDEELDPVEILGGKEDTKDVVPTAFLVMDQDSWVWAIHLIGIANLKDHTIPIHGITFGFASNLQDLGNGTWTLLMLAELHPSMMLSINQYKTAPQKACEATSHEADVEALLSAGSVSNVYLPQAFPLPVMLITYDLEKRTHTPSNILPSQVANKELGQHGESNSS
jgi:hypothetical protein